MQRIFKAYTPGGPLPNTARLYEWYLPTATTEKEANLSRAIWSFDAAFGNTPGNTEQHNHQGRTAERSTRSSHARGGNASVRTKPFRTRT